MDMIFKGDTLSIDCIDKGKGEVIVILQGWGTTASLYESLIRLLSENFRVIAPDFPGFGASTEPSFAYDTADYADFVLELLKKLGVEEASFIGHSHGGRVLLELASRENVPVSIKKLVLIDSAGLVAKKTLSQRIRIRTYKCLKQILLTKPVKVMFPTALSSLQKAFGSADYASSSPLMRQSMVKLVNTDYREKLSLIREPTLLIWGEKDDATPLYMAKIMENAIPDAGLVTVPNGGHFSFVDDPVLTERVLRSFFEF